MTTDRTSEELLKDLILRLVEEEEWEEIRQAVVGQHPADIADILRAVPTEVVVEHLFALVEEDAKPDVLAHLEGDAAQEVIESLTSAELSDLVEEMSPDDAADVIADLPLGRSAEVLELMETEESEDVRELLKYDDESAGGIMTSEIVAFRGDLSVAEAMDQLSRLEQDEPVYNAYVVDDHNRLTGAIGLWELIKVRDRGATVASVAHEDVVTARTDMDQEEVARLMRKYDLTAIPVVDTDKELVGRITVDDAMDVLQEEASEDIFRLAGSDDAELTYTSPLQASRARLPWLLVTLVLTFVSSLVLKLFMMDLADVLALSFFVPVITAMCGSTGMQSSTLVIRGIALKSMGDGGALKILRREFLAGILMGLICSVIMGLWARWVISDTPSHLAAYPPLFLASAVGVALVTAMTFAAVYGAVVPILLNKLRIDPAVASGPFVTASDDIFALLIYYGTSVALMGLYRHFA